SLRVDSRGAGVAVSGTTTTTYVGLRDGRSAPLHPASAGGGDLEQGAAFLRNGDGVLRRIERSSVPSYALMATTSARAGDVWVIEAPDSDGAEAWQLLSASDAPVLAWIHGQGFPA